MSAPPHRRLAVVFGLTVAVLVAEIVGGLWSHSLALLADAGHMATDVAGIGLALLALHFAGRPATAARTFGYQRAEILAAVVNAMLLFAVSGFVLVEAVRRMLHPPEVDAPVVLAFGVLGLGANAVGLVVLHRHHAESLNLRGAFLEVLSDFLGSAAVLVAAGVVAVTGFHRADAIASLLIGVLILPRTWAVLREAVDILLEATPKGVNLAHVRDHIRRTPGVLDVHDLHAWTITSGVPVVSAHVVVEVGALRDGHGGQVLDRLQDCLGGHFDVAHCTFQLEPAGHADHEPATHR